MKNFSFYALVILLFFACGKGTPSLPQKRPADLKINYHVDGGMSDYSVDIDISGDSCHYRKRQEGKVKEQRFKLSAAELDAVYASFQKNEFDKITWKTADGFVYDRGGTNIDLAWQGKQIRVSDAQNSFVSEKWYASWKALCEDLDSFAIRKSGF